MSSKILPPTWLLIAILLMAALHFVIPLALIVPSPWNVFGLIPVMLGIVLNLFADRAFHQAHTTIKPFETPSKLVTQGVFRLSRNPMYLGFMLILIGVAVLLGTLSPLLVIFLFFAWIDRAFISLEEHSLEQTFGSAWLKYKECTRRWI